MKITSSAFEHQQNIPAKYTCKGENINPPLQFVDVPNNAKSLVLIVDDPDAPAGTWVHWVVFNILATNQIAEDSIPGVQGSNDFGKTNYGGPCPPSGTHRYFHKIYALDTVFKTSETFQKKELENAMKGHILDKAELVGRYKKESLW